MSATAESAPATSGLWRSATEADVARLNLLVGQTRRFPFSWAGQRAALRFTMSEAAPAPVTYLRVRLDDHSFDLGLAARPEPAALGVAFAGIELSALPGELLLGVLEAWLEDPVQSLRAQSIGLQLEACHEETPTAPLALGWEISLGENPHFLAGTLHADTAALNHLASLAGRRAPVATGNADALPVALHVVIARLPLTPPTLGALQAGDVLFPPLTAATRAAGACELWHRGTALASAQLRKNSLEIRSMKAAAATDTKTPPAENLRVDELPVTVSFDVGQLDVTVGQLRSIGSGYTFELPAEPGRLVTLRVNGREIGHGELVEFGDKVGVRIADWRLA
jgi:type III secretion protein Q